MKLTPWRLRRLAPDRLVFQRETLVGVIALDVHDGCGIATTIAAWRLSDRVLTVFAAGEA